MKDVRTRIVERWIVLLVDGALEVLTVWLVLKIIGMLYAR